MTEIQEREALAHLMIAVRRFLSDTHQEKQDVPSSAVFKELVLSLHQVNQNITQELKRLDDIS